MYPCALTHAPSVWRNRRCNFCSSVTRINGHAALNCAQIHIRSLEKSQKDQNALLCAKIERAVQTDFISKLRVLYIVDPRPYFTSREDLTPRTVAKSEVQECELYDVADFSVNRQRKSNRILLDRNVSRPFPELVECSVTVLDFFQSALVLSLNDIANWKIRFGNGRFFGNLLSNSLQEDWREWYLKYDCIIGISEFCQGAW